MKKIIVPTDFGKQASLAYNVAANLAKKLNATIELFHVLGSNMSYLNALAWGGDPAYYAKLTYEEEARHMQEAETKLSETSKLPVFSGCKVETSIVSSNESPIDALLEFMNNENHSLLVMGTAGRDKRGESNAEVIARKSTIPVISIRSEVQEFDIKRIVLPTDFKTVHRKFLEGVLDIAKAYNATIKLLYVNTQKNFKDTLYVRREAEKFAYRFQIEEMTDLEIYNAYDLEEGILSYAKYYKADLLAMPTEGKTGLDRLFGSSSTEDVINNAELPVYSYNMHNEYNPTQHAGRQVWVGGFHG